jgi:uncharacterized protein YndB with AHSA1/START domain
MNSNLLFDFVVDKDNSTINIKKEFNANLSLIWDAYTKSELLDQWWAPKPFINKTKKMDFREGGMWHYSMTDQNGQSHWCRLDYLTISAQESYSALDAFCDENGKLNEEIPRTNWEIKFTENEGSTLVDSLLTYNSLSDLETILGYGFKEGAMAGINQLEELIETLKKL